MSRIVVSVATDSWIRLQDRLLRKMHDVGEATLYWRQQLPPGSPPHREAGVCAATLADSIRPYAFKAYALKAAEAAGHTSLLWCDACIVPLRSLAPLWDRIEQDGYWICRNGWMNDTWTANSAYSDLWPEASGDKIGTAMSENGRIPHVVATAFGISLKHSIGRAFLDEYYRLASETRAFCGPWVNTNNPENADTGWGYPRGPCGPANVRGHRHDQTCASVIAWRLGMVLDSPPTLFAYENPAQTTILQASRL